MKPKLKKNTRLPEDHPSTEEKPKRSLLKPFIMTGIILTTVAGLGEWADHYIAKRWNYPKYLGTTWHGMYSPTAWMGWQKAWGPQDKEGFLTVDSVFGGVVLVGGLLLLGVGMATNRNRRARPHAGVHGTAKFADSVEQVQDTGLLPPDTTDGTAVYVGGWTDPNGNLCYLRHSGPEHVLAVAPTRSGKGLGLILPTLLSWKHSVVIHDMKGELWQQTAGWRKQKAGNKVLRFDPAAPVGSCNYNILAEVRLGTLYEVSDVQNLVTIIVDPEGTGIEGDHWAGSALSLLTGVIIHLLYKAAAIGADTPCLYDVGSALANPRQTSKQLWDEMIENRHLTDANGDRIAHPVVAQAASDMKQLCDDEHSSVLSTTKRFLTIYRDPLVHANIKRSDFLARDLANASQPVSLYIVIRPADRIRLRPIVRLLVNQIMVVLTRDELKFDNNNRPLMPHKHRLLMMMDELPALKRLQVFEESLAFVAGYGIKCYVICQDFNQLWKSYGENEEITSNCHIRIFYAPNRTETAQKISDMTSTMTVNKEDVSENGKAWSGVDGISRTFHEISRPLLTTGEILTMKAPKKDSNDLIIEPGDMLIFAAGHAPIYGTQILYFRDPVFNERARLAPPAQTDIVRVSTIKSPVPYRAPFKLAARMRPIEVDNIAQVTPSTDTVH
jgi:type IV secretion system protein VirD4